MTTEIAEIVISQGVVRTVALLGAQGFRVLDSGLDRADAAEWDHAYVTIVVQPGRLIAEAHRLVDTLRRFGVPVVTASDNSGAHVQATFEPVDEMSFLEIRNIHDRMLRTPESIEVGQRHGSLVVKKVGADRSIVRVVCDCGVEAVIQTDELRGGRETCGHVAKGVRKAGAGP